MTIAIGDHVQWQERSTRRRYLYSRSGQVTSLNDANATVLCDGRLYMVPLHKLTKVGAIEAVVDDYEYALRHCGDLGGIELL